MWYSGVGKRFWDLREEKGRAGGIPKKMVRYCAGYDITNIPN